MGSVTYTIESLYDVGDIVIFHRFGHLIVGIIEGFYPDRSCDDSIWYDIRINGKDVFTYSNGGDIAEWDIVGKITDPKLLEECKKYICEDDSTLVDCQHKLHDIDYDS